MATHVRAHVEHEVSHNGTDWGYNLHVTRISQYGERASALVVTELSEADLIEIIRASAVALGQIRRGEL